MADTKQNNSAEGVQDQLLSIENELPERGVVNNEVILETVAPDGGLRAWSVMLGSFVCNGLVFGLGNSYSVLYNEILLNLQEAGVSESSSKAALVGSLNSGLTFGLSPIGGILIDKIGIRRSTVIGGGLAAMGIFCSSFAINNVEALYVTYGVMNAAGGALVATSSLSILNHYFCKYLGFANGFATAGSSIFTVVMPFVTEMVIKLAGLQKSFWVIAALVVCTIFCAILFKPLPLRVQPKKQQPHFRGIINITIWKNKRYIIWVIGVSLSLIGYFVPYVHMRKFVEETFSGQDGKLPIVCIAITSSLGRLIFGYIADLPKVDRILLQQTSFLIIGLATMCIPFCPSFTWLLVLSLVMGLFDGGFVVLIGLNVFDLCGQEGFAQAIGFFMGFAAIFIISGPPIVGTLYDYTGSYQIPMIFAGIPTIVGFLVLLLLKYVTDPSSRDRTRPSN